MHSIRFAFLAVLSLLAAPAFTQSPAPMPKPNLQLAKSGRVDAMVRLPDGSTLIGGLFRSVNGVPRTNIAKLRPDGTLDATWNLAADGWVWALAADGAGNVYVGGSFSTIGGLGRNLAAKLSGSGASTVDPNWNPSPPAGVVKALATDGSGNVFVGGSFTNIGGQARKNLAKLSSGGAGAADPSWNPSTDGSVDDIASDGSGNIYVAGGFTTIGGASRMSVAKLSAGGVGAVDPNWNPSPNDKVLSISLDATGNVYVGGDFIYIGGQYRNFIAKLSNGAGSADPNWNPSADNGIETVATDASGNVYASGWFGQIGGLNRNRIAKLSSGGTGAAVANWNPSIDGIAFAISPDNGGTIYAAGDFNLVGGQQHLGLAVVSSDGAATAPTADVESPGHVWAMAKQPDGSFILGGDFQKADQEARVTILRLLADGTLDMNWNPAPDGYVSALATDALGGVFVGGGFSTIGGQSRSGLAKLSGSGIGAADPSWNPAPNAGISALAVNASSGDVYVSGGFTSIGGQNRSYLAKLSGSGTGAANAIWDPSPDSGPTTLAVDTVGDIYVGGWFSQVGGQGRDYLAKLSGDGTGAADPNWNPSPNNGVSALAFDTGGSVYAGGNFTSIGGKSRGYVAKLASNGIGSADASWNPSANAQVLSLTSDQTGHIYVGGWFGTIGGQNRTYLARLSSSGTGAADATWNPSADNVVLAMVPDQRGNMYVAGNFGTTGGQARTGVAAFAGETIFANGFE